MSNNTVKKKIQNPFTGKNLGDIHIEGKGTFRWNTVYKVYNAVEGYEQLQRSDVSKISWDLSK